MLFLFLAVISGLAAIAALPDTVQACPPQGIDGTTPTPTRTRSRGRPQIPLASATTPAQAVSRETAMTVMASLLGNMQVEAWKESPGISVSFADDSIENIVPFLQRVQQSRTVLLTGLTLNTSGEDSYLLHLRVTTADGVDNNDADKTDVEGSGSKEDSIEGEFDWGTVVRELLARVASVEGLAMSSCRVAVGRHQQRTITFDGKLTRATTHSLLLEKLPDWGVDDFEISPQRSRSLSSDPLSSDSQSTVGARVGFTMQFNARPQSLRYSQLLAELIAAGRECPGDLMLAFSTSPRPVATFASSDFSNVARLRAAISKSLSNYQVLQADFEGPNARLRLLLSAKESSKNK